MNEDNAVKKGIEESRRNLEFGSVNLNQSGPSQIFLLSFWHGV